MNCDQAKKYLTALEQGELDEEESEKVRSHLGQCDKCATDLREMEAGVALLRALPSEDVPPGFAESVVARLPQQTGWRPWMVMPKVAWGGGLAALAVALVGFGVWVGKVTTQRELALTRDQTEQYAPGEAPGEAGLPGRPLGITVEPEKRGALGPFAQLPSGPAAPEQPLPPSAAPTAPRGDMPAFAAAPPPSRGSEATTTTPRSIAEVGAMPAVTAGPEAVATGPGRPPAVSPITPSGAVALAVAPPAEGARADRPSAPLEAREEEATARPPTPVLATDQARERRFDLTLEGARLVDALRLVASVDRKSLDVAPDVKGTVTVRMRNVTADEALDKLGKEFDLSVETRDETIIVRRLEENSQILSRTAIG